MRTFVRLGVAVVTLTTALQVHSMILAQQTESPAVEVETLPHAASEIGSMPKFLNRAVAWLIEAQHSNGGWGAGSHANQQIRDPHQVQVDPATTSFVGLTLLRAGHTPFQGDYQTNVRRAVEYLLGVVEIADSDGPRITHLEGTQPQQKLGPLVDTSLTAQYLARILPTVPKNDPLYARIDRALDKCLVKLSASQQQDGSWGRQGGWAPVLQSALSCNALEIAATNGKQVDKDILERARSYQKSNIDARTGSAKATGDSAGVELYAFAGGGRGNAADAREAKEVLDQAISRGDVGRGGSASSADNLQAAGLSEQRAKRLARAYTQNENQIRRLNDETLLAGFGNNGGEEFLSYVLTSETLVIAGGDRFQEWDKKMRRRLKKVQNNDGSWSGHHCITSPVFCTAAVVQCLTTDRDREFLVSIATKQADVAVATSDRNDR